MGQRAGRTGSSIKALELTVTQVSHCCLIISKTQGKSSWLRTHLLQNQNHSCSCPSPMSAIPLELFRPGHIVLGIGPLWILMHSFCTSPESNMLLPVEKGGRTRRVQAWHEWEQKSWQGQTEKADAFRSFIADFFLKEELCWKKIWSMKIAHRA